MHMVRELRHLAGEKWLAFDGLEPLMERLANNRPKLHVALNNLELTITKDTHSMRALIKEFTPCQWSNDEKAWVGIFGNDAEVRDTLNVILEFCTFWGWIVEPDSPSSKEPPSSPGMTASSVRGGFASTTLCSSGVLRRVWSVTSTSLVACVWCILLSVAME